MANAIQASITCAQCGNPNATVHVQEKGTKKGRRYIRCYSTPGGLSMECGTLQCIGPAGQKFIEANMRPYSPKPLEKPAEKPAPEPIGQREQLPATVPAPEPEPKPVTPPKARPGFLSGLASLLSED